MANYIDLNRKLQKDAAGNIIKLVGDEVIDNSIKTILSTYPGERYMLPEFGSRLRQLLFEPITDITSTRIRIEIQDALGRWEDRISVINVKVRPIVDRGIYNIEIQYKRKDTKQDNVFFGKIRKLD